MSESADVVVIGAGVVGGAVAYFLSLEGLKVCLMDREAVGSGASAHGHGLISLVGKDFKQGPHFLLGLEGARIFPQFVAQLTEETGIDPMYQEMASVALAIIEEAETIYREVMPWQQAYLDMRWADVQEIRDIEPRITPEARGGVLSSHAQVDGYRLSLAQVQVVERRGGRLLLRKAIGLQTNGNQVTGVNYPGA